MNKTKLSTIHDLTLYQKRIFLRLDLNVPLKNGEITSDFKLRSVLPTLEFLRAEPTCQIVIATHLGEPKAKQEYEPTKELSTKVLVTWLKEQDIPIQGPYSLTEAIAALDHGAEIVMLENLRFFGGEATNSPQLAQKLKQLGDLYINDAFGVFHREHCSVSALPRLYSKENKAIGLLAQHELDGIAHLKKSIARPYVVVIGGNKLDTKLSIIEKMLMQPAEARPDIILVGGTIAGPFLNLPTTIKDQAKLTADRILNLAERHDLEVYAPSDHVVIDGRGHYQVRVTEEVDPDMTVVDIGPVTRKLYAGYIKTARSVFANGTMGVYENSESELGTKAIMQALAQSDAYTLVGGGNAIDALEQYELLDKISYVSTGGGASLAALAVVHLSELPALAALLHA